jgi:hypothetical protein
VYSVKESNSFRQQDDYLPVHHLSTDEVRELVDERALGHHWAYDSEPGAMDWSGMTRLSCATCIMSRRSDLILAARRRPRLATLFAEVERRIGHSFTLAISMRQVLELAQGPGGPEPGVVLDEAGPEFDALERIVLAQANAPVKLPASTEFTTVPISQLARIGHH